MRYFIYGLFAIAIVTGFTPWERLFAVEIRGALPELLTSMYFGFAGVLGLLISMIIHYKKGKKRFAFGIIGLSAILSVCTLILMIIAFVSPTFKWKDEVLYRNGNNYLIEESFDNFVTNNIMPSRIVFTKHPNALIRKFKIITNIDEKTITIDSLIYLGKVWRKQAD